MKVIESLYSYFTPKSQVQIAPDKVVHSKLPNGAIYTGRIINGKLEGLGTLAYDNGERYEGEFLNGMKHGKGKYYYIRGELYIGDWYENKKHGQGQYFYENGQRYCGQFNNNMKHGKGVLIESDGSEYRGQFLENRKHGRGEYHDALTNKTYGEVYEHGKQIERYQKIEQEKFNTRELDGQSVQPDAILSSVSIKSLYENINEWEESANDRQNPAHYSLIQKQPDSTVSLSSNGYLPRERSRSRLFYSGTFLAVNKKILLWTVEDVGTWLEGLGLSEYNDRFKNQDIDGCALLELNESDLKDVLGVVIGDRKDLMREITMLRLIFKKQLYQSYNDVKNIDFNLFTVEDMANLDTKSKIKLDKKPSDHIEDNEDSSSSQSSQQEKEKFQVLKHKKLKSGKKRNIEKIVEDYLKKHGIKLNFLIPKDEIEILQPIGQGGYGQVYLGRWLGQEVAVKRYMKQQGLRNRHIGHFIEEVQLINRLLHPSIVLYMGMCIYDDQYAMITEFLSNGSLFDYLHKHHKKLSQERTFYIIKDIALGMTYLHGKRVLHCDLKSSNVLIDQNWNVKLCDFGLSRINSNHKKGQARRVGTPHWMAPEILRGEKYEFESDVYSFGMLVWELLTGEIPYQKYSPAQIIGLVGRDDNHQILLPKTDNQPMIDLFLMCTKRDPKQRPSFASVVEYLEKHESKYQQHLDKI